MSYSLASGSQRRSFRSNRFVACFVVCLISVAFVLRPHLQKASTFAACLGRYSGFSQVRPRSGELRCKTARRAAEPVRDFKVPAATEQVLLAVKENVGTCIKKGTRRVDIELPAGLRLGGIEGPMDTLTISDQEMPPERIARADRDLARMFAILFGAAMGGSVCYAFRTTSLAKAAKKIWQKKGHKGFITAFSQGSKVGFNSADADAEQFRRTFQESGCQFLMVVAPRLKQLRLVEQMMAEDSQKDLGFFFVECQPSLPSQA